VTVILREHRRASETCKCLRCKLLYEHVLSCVANLASVEEYIKMGVLASYLESLDHSTSRKANFATRQEICHILWNPEVLCHVHSSPALVIPIHMTPIHALPSYFVKIPFNIIVPSTPTSFDVLRWYKQNCSETEGLNIYCDVA